MGIVMALNAPLFDPHGAGFLYLRPESIDDFFGGQRRQTRTPTLDGGVSLYDTGYTVSDQTWQIRTVYNPSAISLVEHLSLVYQRIFASTPAGYFEISLQSWQRQGLDLVLTLAVIRKVGA